MIYFGEKTRVTFPNHLAIMNSSQGYISLDEWRIPSVIALNFNLEKHRPLRSLLQYIIVAKLIHEWDSTALASESVDRVASPKK